MFLSTSSSKRFRDFDSCLWPWLCGIFLALVALASIEFIFRSLGYSATITASNDKELWSYHRTAISSADNELVILGSSRAANGLSIQEFRKYFPALRVTQLAIHGSHFFPALKDLSEDSKFKGIVICELTEEGLAPARRDTQQAYVDYQRNLSHWYNRLASKAVATIQEKLVFLNPSLGINGFMQNPLGDKANFVNSGRRADRSGFCEPEEFATLRDYIYDVTENSLKSARPKTMEEWLIWVRELQDIIVKIQQRGAQVIFVRLPTSGKLSKLYTDIFPTQYWSTLTENVSAPFITSHDDPSLAGLVLADDSHLCGSQPDLVTRALADEIRHRGLLSRFSK